MIKRMIKKDSHAKKIRVAHNYRKGDLTQHLKRIISFAVQSRMRDAGWTSRAWRGALGWGQAAAANKVDVIEVSTSTVAMGSRAPGTE